MTALIDTNVILAYAFAKDKNHQQAVALMKVLSKESLIVVAPVLAELFYMTAIRLHYPRAIQIFASTQAAFPIENLRHDDMARMQAIMTQYQDAAFDFVDVAIMAVAERLHIVRVGTFDRRDFTIFRPAHCDHLELLPD